jgi:hypothetical protein
MQEREATGASAERMPGTRLEMQAADGVAVEERIDEKEFMQMVIDYAKWNEWKVVHIFDSRRSDFSWPDLFLVRGSKAMAAECKKETGRLTAEKIDLGLNCWAQLESKRTYGSQVIGVRWSLC